MALFGECKKSLFVSSHDMITCNQDTVLTSTSDCAFRHTVAKHKFCHIDAMLCETGVDLELTNDPLHPLPLYGSDPMTLRGDRI